MQTFPLSEPNERQHSTLTGDSRNETALRGLRSFLAERLAARPDNGQQLDGDLVE
ncbi:hypothetical protein ARTSIC4J27_2202 [Pseudarthrobacter siccitolerans]|uniref:Uncharacterized protein n=2 Tax=Pseudarthrobacter siccitolerans TaxID=861266 RepID=A0A024H3C4_9MICC|nr:hypothetical protein ARTSIC4J27_2202 [Pseudarthrobacter siccitolerans]